MSERPVNFKIKDDKRYIRDFGVTGINEGHTHVKMKMKRRRKKKKRKKKHLKIDTSAMCIQVPYLRPKIDLLLATSTRAW